MLTNIFTKTIRDRWRGISIAAGSLAMMLFFAMSVYRNIDISIFTELPDTFLTMMGIPAGAGIGSLAIGELFVTYGAWVLAGLAIVAGSASIAGALNPPPVS